MTDSAPKHAPKAEIIPVFPSWPFGCTAFYSHLGNDFGKYAETMSHATSSAEAVRAESVYGMHLVQDLAKGFYELALAPYTALFAALAEGSDAPSVVVDEAREDVQRGKSRRA